MVSPPQTLFTVDGGFASVSQRRRIQDATGLPLFEIARKRLGVTWFVHIPGSKERADPHPVATVVPQRHMLMDKFDVHFSNAAGGNDGREEIVLSVRDQDIWKSRTHEYYGDALVMTSKLKDMVAVYVPGKRPEWEIEVAEGVDLSLAAIIGVLLAAMLYQSSVTGKASESFGEGDPAVGTSEKASLM
ncbi:hypothetical protein IFM58399_10439 [Aspergillus lentulus]|uniref:uncharacterized protein n=1 Tax=Aspergillus lentulus TaxID=293939 RepID=UPI0013926FEA|nr:uncharacterized protein IFM58399_10439 [Aspergillus lentulus]KAF4153839.1 hypothetical protein CNMCM6069_000264 [Aspergillus lentulus]KAF4173150.1 hypothetical protein CNMCM8060_000569 [Aspergillus lentulus]KAF4192609.1 hypothetical protein CNMCM8694_000144 [Aspergillus lentulus]GFF56981.1 hypothetical protein IFM58399_10439 [Aspergillus lentulus]GFF81219.1 hypothetical protein IFM62136_10474 [Aspergillus lentulus]